jgi:lysozyme
MNREKLLDMLMLHEGLELKPYQCTADKTSIGVGRNLQDLGISEDEAKYLLNNDVDRILKEVEHWTFLEKLNDVRQAVIL